MLPHVELSSYATRATNRKWKLNNPTFLQSSLSDKSIFRVPSVLGSLSSMFLFLGPSPSGVRSLLSSIARTSCPPSRWFRSLRLLGNRMILAWFSLRLASSLCLIPVIIFWSVPTRIFQTSRCVPVHTRWQAASKPKRMSIREHNLFVIIITMKRRKRKHEDKGRLKTGPAVTQLPVAFWEDVDKIKPSKALSY